MTQPSDMPSQSVIAQHHLDTTGLICPEPVMLLHKAIRGADSGEVIEVIATDPATTRDIPNFCRHLGHTLLSQTSDTSAVHVNTHMQNSQVSVSDNRLDDSSDDPLSFYRYLIQKK